MRQLKRLRLSDSDIIYKVMDDPVERPSAIQRLKDSRYYVFSNLEETALVMYDPLVPIIPWYNSHAYSTPKCRGKELRDFFWHTGLRMFNEEGCEVITAVVQKSHRHQKLFLRSIGAQRQYEDTLGNVFYTFDKLLVPRVVEKLGKEI